MDIKLHFGESTSTERPEKAVTFHDKSHEVWYLNEAGSRVPAPSGTFVMPLLHRKRKLDKGVAASGLGDFIKSAEVAEVGHQLKGDKVHVYVSDVKQSDDGFLEYDVNILDVAGKTSAPSED